MFDHDCDTDEDCEVYFLKPVNEYNIVDKIKEANRELFNAGGDSTDTPAEQMRKVKFHPNLEEYPEDEDGSAENDDVVSLNIVTINEDDEVDNATEVANQRTITAIEKCAEMLALEVQKKIEAIEIKMAESEEEVEEISEEIVVMDMDTGRKLEEDTKELNAIKKDESSDTINHDNNSGAIDSADEIPEENEGDDNLSIIVASYLPPDNLTTACEESESSSMTKTQSFRKNFSFRRKNSSKINNCRSPEITNLKLNYKTCCEYRNSDCDKLPKYTGYMSEYGLSRDQLDKREQTMQSKHKVVAEKNLKATEAEVRKMQDNERAFTTWLKNKMRFPINRTRNMFDVKKANNNSGNNRGGVFRPKLCGSNKNGGVF